jgi:hypothetical protein
MNIRVAMFVFGGNMHAFQNEFVTISHIAFMPTHTTCDDTDKDRTISEPIKYPQICFKEYVLIIPHRHEPSPIGTAGQISTCLRLFVAERFVCVVKFNRLGWSDISLMSTGQRVSPFMVRSLSASSRMA